DGAAAVTPGQGTGPEQPVVVSGERGTVEVGVREEECAALQGGGCISSSGGGGDGGGGESGTEIDAAIPVSTAGAEGAGGVEMVSSSNPNHLDGCCGGIESGGGDGANHDETRTSVPMHVVV
ncbi:unnamed protein product, partial [Ectocarpus sp. 12 AP-2014]